MKRLIKNYTTEISVEQTIGEIQKILAENGASGIAQDYTDGIVTALYFKVTIEGRILPFKLPVKSQSVYNALYAGKIGERSYGTQRMKSATKIAWRICKTWLEAQITLVNLEQAKIEEVFLPYLLVDEKRTLYDKMKENQFLLPEPK